VAAGRWIVDGGVLSAWEADCVRMSVGGRVDGGERGGKAVSTAERGDEECRA